MPTPALGRLRTLQAREVWTHEALGFTPWLKQNIELLGEALGLEIEVESEVSVGNFSVDLAGKELASGRPLIVENQLEQTDHGHLGQLLTYASGLDAAVIVWISPHFRDEHRQAVDWLNQHTDKELDFFGIELELLQIDSSLPAPHFKLVAQPNEWAKTTRQTVAGKAPSDRAVRYQRFFDQALTRFKELRPGVTSATRTYPQNWYTMSAGRTGYSFSWSFPTGKRFRTELYIDTGDQAANKAAFDQLAGRAPDLEGSLGIAISWERLDDKQASRVSVYYPHALRGRNDEDGQLIEWAADSLARMSDLFRPLVKTL